jgi:hypothetical protein
LPDGNHHEHDDSTPGHDRANLSRARRCDDIHDSDAGKTEPLPPDETNS